MVKIILHLAQRTVEVTGETVVCYTWDELGFEDVG